MKYAIFSDIHGNIYALRAALADAQARGADKYLFIGDYAHLFPWGNDVINTIRAIKPAVVICGNGEEYIKGSRGKSQDEWVYEQMKPFYWAYRSLSDDNLKFIDELPEHTEIRYESDIIYLSHALSVFFRSQRIEPFHSSQYPLLMKGSNDYARYLEIARSAVMSRADALADIMALPKGVYLFGHNHLQFYMEYEDRLFVNPGSCGVAMDMDNTAAYTIIERDGPKWIVTERRVKYDVDFVADELHACGYYEYSPIWSEVMISQLMTGKDYFARFLIHLMETGRRLGQTGSPVSNEVWAAAVKTWDISKHY